MRTMKNLTRRIASTLRAFFLGQQKQVRRNALLSEISHTFQRLECRRVLSVTAAFDNTNNLGKLTIDILNDGGITDASLLIDGSNFFADTNNDQSSAGEAATGLLSSLKQIQVNGAAGVGTFAWRGDFTASNSLQSLLVQNVNSASIASTAVIQNDANVSAQTSIDFGGNVSVNGNLTAQVTGNSGLISDNVNASLHVLPRLAPARRPEIHPACATARRACAGPRRSARAR